MDRPGPPGHGDRRPASYLSGVCLERTIELAAVSLAVREWPGLEGPIIHLPDPLRPSFLGDAFASRLAPRLRLLSVALRGDVAYQVCATDLAGAFDQFGFRGATLVAEGLVCGVALLLVAWYPQLVGRLALVEPVCEPPSGDELFARSLRECPPDWSTLRASVRCRVLESSAMDEIESFVTSPLP